MNKKLISLVLLISILLYGCGYASNNATRTMTEEEISYNVRVNIVSNKSDYETVIAKLLTGETLSAEDINISIIDNMSIDDSVLNITKSEFNWFNGSIYVKINDAYIYRFQLNSSNQIESYIKYELEA